MRDSGFRSIGLLLLLASAPLAAAQPVDTTRFWTDVQDPAAAPGRALRLDVAALRRYLGRVPPEGRASASFFDVSNVDFTIAPVPVELQRFTVE